MAIVVSILFAFGIDAWWHERQERMEEQLILQGLDDEFALIRTVLMSHREVHLHRLLALERFVSTIDEDRSVISAGLLGAVLADLLAPTTSDISNGTLHALLGSGRLEILSSRSLRERLVAWESAIGEVWDDQHFHSALVRETYLPFLVSEGFGIGDVNRMWYAESTTPVRAIGDDPSEMKRLLNDSRFHSIVEANYLYKQHLTEELELAISAVDEILAEISRSRH